MFVRTAAVLAALAFAGASNGQEVKSLAYYQLAVGQRFEIQTENCLYRGQLLNRSTGEAVMSAARDGQIFGPERTVFLLGATQGRQEGYLLVLMHQVKVDMKMELGIDDLADEHRYVTAPVTSIRVLPTETGPTEVAQAPGR
jgi:hypothetical protein